MAASSIVTTRMLPPGSSAPALASSVRRPSLPTQIPEAMGVGQMLDQTVVLYREHFVPLTVLALLFAFPLQLGAQGLTASRMEEMDSLVPGLLWIATGLPMQVAVNAMAFAYVGSALKGQARSAPEATALAFSKLPTLLGILLVAGAVVMATCGVGAFVSNWLLGPAIGLVVLEGGTLWSTIPRAVALASGWASFGRWMGIYLITSLILGGLGGVDAGLHSAQFSETALATSFLGTIFLNVILPLMSALLMALQMSITAVSMVVFYFDLCVRRRGLDLNRRLDQLASPATQDANSPLAQGGIEA